MMSLQVEFFSNTKKIFSGLCQKAILPSEKGPMEVSARHVDFIVNLNKGTTLLSFDKEKPIKFNEGIGVAFKKAELLTILVEEDTL